MIDFVIIALNLFKVVFKLIQIVLTLHIYIYNKFN